MSYRPGHSVRSRSSSRGPKSKRLNALEPRRSSSRGPKSERVTTLEPSPYSLSLVDPSPYSHAESHHVIRFKAPTGPTLVTPEKPRHSTRDQARLSVKKRLESTLNDSVNTEASIKTKSKLKTGKERRGRERSRSRSRGAFRRSLSSKRGKASSGDSVCSASSAKSSRSIRSVGSRVMTKVKSFKRSKSISGKSVNSTSSRRSFWRRRRKKTENFVYVKQTPTPILQLKKKPRKNHNDDPILGLGLLCSSFEQVTLCRDYLCGGTDEELIGTVIGVEDPNDPRY